MNATKNRGLLNVFILMLKVWVDQLLKYPCCGLARYWAALKQAGSFLASSLGRSP